MELYVLKMDLYKEWAWENGASKTIGVYDDIELAINELKNYLKMETKDGHITEYGNEIDECIDDIDRKRNVYIDVWANEQSYDNGFEDATYCIEKVILNEKGVVENDR